MHPFIVAKVNALLEVLPRDPKRADYQVLMWVTGIRSKPTACDVLNGKRVSAGTVAEILLAFPEAKFEELFDLRTAEEKEVTPDDHAS